MLRALALVVACASPSFAQVVTPPQFLGSSLPATAAYHTHVGIQDAARPSDYHDAGTIASNKFIDVTATTVRCFSGGACGNDYATGPGAVFIWGRPGYDVQPGRQAHMYLMVHRLPIRRNRAGAVQLRPRYFAGVRADGEPLWTRHESRAKALSMDGVVDGNPDDDLPNPNQTEVSWLGPPVNRWMMLYGGGGSSVSGGLGPDATAGPIMVRFADHPWGPWSPPVVHLDPGSPMVAGNPFGPGGYVFHPACTDQPPAVCAASDPTRPLDYFLPGCPSVGANLDTGIFYGPNIIEAYTRADGAGGLDVFWNVSVWNPYLVALLKTNVRPDASGAATTTCKAGRPGGRFRWCAKGE